MPVTASLSTENPLGIALPSAYAVATNIHSDLTVTNGVLNPPSVMVYYAVWPSEAAQQAGDDPIVSATITGPLDVSSGSLASTIETVLLAAVQALPYTVSASIINT